MVSPGDSPTRNARGIYERADAVGSKQFHENAALSRSLLDPIEPAHQDSRFCGDILKPLVFGGLDGINTTFAVIAGAIGADFSVANVLIMGFVCLFGGAFSMGLGECSSSTSELELKKWEREREAWEMDNYPEGEITEMVDIYRRKGMAEEDAKQIMLTMAKYRDIFIDHMMVEELGMIMPAANNDLKTDGLVMFASFGVLGAVPLLSFIVQIALWGREEEHCRATSFFVSCALTAVTLVFLGLGQASYRKQSKLSSCSQMLLNAIISGSVAYVTGRFLKSLLA